MTLTGAAAVAGVIGWPIAHSLSPRLHGFWLREYAVDGAYVPLAVAPENLSAALHGLPALGLRGVNVTIPHKVAVIDHVAEVTTTARRIGAVNTVTVRPDGSLHGDNTDAYGFLTNLEDAGWQPDDRPAVVLGAGGAARAVCAALAQAGVASIRLCNRTADRAADLISALSAAAAADTGSLPDLQIVPWADRGAAVNGAGLLVNTTSLGMSGKPPLDLDLTALPTDATVNDIVYTPLTTPLLAAAAAAGHRTVDGLGMLLHQARPGFHAWFGVDPAVTPALRAAVLDPPS